jgi:NADP-dependent 3-hydroxy acid dehydrogenase YdfG
VDQTLNGTVAIVTGASSGIGDVTARRLAEHDAAVAVLARRKDRLDTLVTDQIRCERLTEALRREATQKHVRVGAPEPGAVDTERVSHNN